jgi:hypothetical protein
MNTYRQQDLFNLYSDFCNFGAGAKGASMDSLNMGPLMDNARFAKFSKETGIIDNKTLTTTDIDIMFNKAKEKGARKLDFQTFKKALELVAEKKFSKLPVDEGFLALMDFLFKGKKQAPAVRSTVAETKGTIYDKLTDTSKYTGTHKLRFDEDGKGKGLAGRVDIHQADNKRKNEYGSRSALGGSYNNLSKSTSLSTSLEKIGGKSQTSSNTGLPNKNNTRASISGSSSSINGSNSSLNGKNAGGSVFDRLTDVKGYTGNHKHRFNADGTGRGLAGRDSVPKGANPGKYRGGDVKDLSQILRT